MYIDVCLFISEFYNQTSIYSTKCKSVWNRQYTSHSFSDSWSMCVSKCYCTHSEVIIVFVLSLTWKHVGQCFSTFLLVTPFWHSWRPCDCQDVPAQIFYMLPFIWTWFIFKRIHVSFQTTRKWKCVGPCAPVATPSPKITTYSTQPQNLQFTWNIYKMVGRETEKVNQTLWSWKQ